ncbi:uncharacterized protein [Blastocystis hominis]|uniref:very-long-chain (3R)-3-hydroxyacyl-CoA dehydratase n=1 Tax=Blastocystis hominis TaxID=12968 RepID=D8LZM8_BLAHO|nr:uncharacterized protein [Blastocystis hominis]CBK21267.2 unnamed protein product [Blastocystis hominis]|eukprot:XP_012895315.1 uncharacterized protein [Blastocystis hominis]
MLGWFYLWVLQYQFYTTGSGDFWGLIGTPLKWVQTAAVLEIVHSMLGLVRSPVMTTALQVFSRVMLVWGYANLCPAAQQAWSIRLMVLSWSLVEVPRYMFYLFKLLGLQMPTWLLFLRYNLFYVLYPTGITGEMLTMWKSLPFLKQTEVWSIRLPNTWNFAFSYYVYTIILLLIYVPLGPFMIKNMIRQRQKNVGERERRV